MTVRYVAPMSTPVYFIAHLQVTDADEYRKYEKGFFPVLKEYDAQYISFDDDARRKLEAGSENMMKLPEEAFATAA